MPLTLCHGPSKRYEQVESGGNKSIVLIHHVMEGTKHKIFSREVKKKKTPKINRIQSMHTQSPAKQTIYNIHTNQQTKYSYE